tara:strand:- start:79 stop:1101 length:1023 start_codon:yes stop_codon:yes gene_type:complete
MPKGLSMPLVSIIIPHYNGENIIRECLKSLQNISYKNVEIIVVDNNSHDNSVQIIHNEFPSTHVIASEYNRGFAGGCNYGAKHAKGEYLFILNNDTVHEKNAITSLVKKIETNTSISSVQPKIKNFTNRDYFDYAGGSGGFMDKYCSPFARGRVFNTIEKDLGQYDDSCKIFWASGTAFLTQKNIFEKLNGFDETLFAHMEEIDYHWKCQLLGYEIWVEPKAVIYHHGAITLPTSDPKKTYLNYRNSLVLLTTNYSTTTTLKLLFPRLFMEFLSLIKELLFLRWKHGFAIIRSWFWIISHPTYLYNRRKNLITKCKLHNIYQHSIVMKYFLMGKKTFNKL